MRATRTRRAGRGARRRAVSRARSAMASRPGARARWAAGDSRRPSARRASSSSSSQTSPPWTLVSSGTATSKQTASSAANSRRRNFTRALYPALLRGQSIADPGLGQEIARPRGIRLELTTQMGHVHAQVMRLLGGIRTPDFAEELAVGDNLAGVVHQRDEQSVLD